MLKTQFAFLFLIASVFSQETLKDPKIVLSTENYPPFVGENLSFNGVDAHIVSEAFAEENVFVEYRFYPAARAFQLAKEGRVDGTLPWTVRSGRGEFFEYSDFIIESDKVYLFLQASSSINADNLKKNPLLLKGMKIAGIRSYDYGVEFNELEAAGIITLDRSASHQQNFKKLMKGHVDIAICKGNVGQFVLNQHFTDEERSRVKRVLLKQSEAAFDHILFSKKSLKKGIDWLTIFNRGLKKLKEKGRYQEILKNLDTNFYGRFLDEKKKEVVSEL